MSKYLVTLLAVSISVVAVACGGASEAPKSADAPANPSATPEAAAPSATPSAAPAAEPPK